MAVNLTDRQLVLVNQVAQNEDIPNCKIEAKTGSIKGDNYMGVITTVNIKNENKSLNLILKSAITSEEFRKQMPIRGAYLREVYMYETVFPEFLKFQNENGITNQFNNTAKMFASSLEEGSECLILENMKTKNFNLWNRKVPMNSEHISQVFETYAKFHAVSYAMKTIEPERYENLTKGMADIFLATSSDGWDAYINTAFQQAYEAVGDNEIALERLREFSKITSDFLLKDLINGDEYFIVTHGDCWNNNILFEYEGTEDKKPLKVCFLDWQMARKSSPITDLSYFFYTSADIENLVKFEKYWKIYYDSLSDMLKEFGCDPESVFPFSKFEEHWRKYSRFGLYMSFYLIKMMLGDTTEVPDLVQIVESGQDLISGFNFKYAEHDMYKKRITDLVMFMIDNQFL